MAPCSSVIIIGANSCISISSPLPDMSFPVYKARYRLAIPDPDMPRPRYHTVLFAEMKADISGEVIHVTGDLVVGMKYERKAAKRPEDSATF